MPISRSLSSGLRGNTYTQHWAPSSPLSFAKFFCVLWLDWSTCQLSYVLTQTCASVCFICISPWIMLLIFKRATKSCFLEDPINRRWHGSRVLQSLACICVFIDLLIELLFMKGVKTLSWQKLAELNSWHLQRSYFCLEPSLDFGIQIVTQTVST